MTIHFVLNVTPLNGNATSAPATLEINGFDSAAFGTATLKGSNTIALSGLKSESIGTANVSSGLNIQPTGWEEFASGALTISSRNTIQPNGLEGEFGDTTVYNLLQTLIAQGFDSSEIGTIEKLYNARQIVKALSLLSQASGTAFFENSIRNYNMVGVSQFASGTALVTLARRTVEVQPLAGSIGIPTVGPFLQTITPASLAGTIGNATVLDNRQTITARAVADEAYGTAWLSLSPRILKPMGATGAEEGLQNGQWGNAYCFNLTQIVKHYNDDTEPTGGIFGQYTQIINRNQTITTYGLSSARYGNGSNLTLGPVINPQGIQLEETGLASVTHRVRTVIPEEIPLAPISAYAVVYNDARVLAPASVPSSEYGIATLANTRRTFDRIGGLDSGQIGLAFVADRVRTVTVYYPPGPTAVPEPRVSLTVNTLIPASVDDGNEFGLPWLEERHTIITPRWKTQTDRTGNATVRNLTPEIHPWGLDAAEAGKPYVGLYTRTINAQGLEQTAFGNTIIKDRRLWIQVQAIGAPSVPQNITVAHIPAITTYPQTVYPAGVVGDFGTASLESTFKEVYPFSVTGSIGSPTLIYYGINFEGFGAFTPQDESYGTPNVVSYQTIQLEGLDSEEIGTALMSPWYIKPYYRYPGDMMVKPDECGIATIELQNRAMTAYGLDSVGFGTTAVSHKKRFVYPLGLNSFKRGYPKLNGPKTLRFQGKANTAYGTATVYMPSVGPQTITYGGFGGESFGLTEVQGWIRDVVPVGLDSAQYGTARLHPPEPIIPTGFDAAAFGTALVDYKNRVLTMEGFDSADFSYGAGLFADRLTVKRGQPIMVKGFSSAAYGTGARVSTNPQVIGAKSVAGLIGGAREVRNHTLIIKPWPCLYWPPPFGRASVTFS